MKTNARLLIAATILAATAGMYGCGFFIPNNGAVRVKVNPPAAASALGTKVIPSGTQVIKVFISGDGLSTALTQTFTFGADQQQTSQIFSFDSVPTGTKLASADAFSDAAGQVKTAHGETTFIVTGGNSTSVVVTMAPITASPSPSPSPTPTPTATPQATSTQGSWVGTVTDSILTTDTGLSLGLSQSGTSITGSYTLGQPSHQAGSVGTFAGTITAASPSPSPTAATSPSPSPTATTVADSFTTKQTSGGTNFTFTMSAGSQCTGTFTGTGTASGNGMLLKYSGTDCQGNHLNGVGSLQRVIASPSPSPSPTASPNPSGVSGSSGAAGGSGTNGQTGAGGGANGL